VQPLRNKSFLVLFSLLSGSLTAFRQERFDM
jgi:hypothetical protein